MYFEKDLKEKLEIIKNFSSLTDDDIKLLENSGGGISFDKANILSREHNNKKEDLEKLAENETELRDNNWKENIKEIRSIAQFLKAINKDNPHELGKWGFVVDDSPQKK